MHPPQRAETTVIVAAAPLATETEQTGTVVATSTQPLWAEVNGYVTQSLSNGSSIELGSVVAQVNEQPIVVIAGGVPMYRDLIIDETATAPPEGGEGSPSLGEATRPSLPPGDDIAALEFFLVSTGHLGEDPDRTFTAATGAAAARWRAANGLGPTPGFRRSELAIVRVTAPWTVLSGPQIGDRVGSGEQLLEIAGSGRAISVPVDGEPDTTTSNTEWHTDAGALRLDEELTESAAAREAGDLLEQPEIGLGSAEVMLTPVEPDALRDTAPGEQVQVNRVDTLSPIAPIVPASSLRQAGDGTLYVHCSRNPDGPFTDCHVEVLAALDGEVAVSGDVAAGDHVRASA